MLLVYRKTENSYQVASPLIVNEKDGSTLVRIPAGEFEMGDGKESNCPKHAVYLDEYYIGVYAVTNRQYKRFVDETGYRPPDEADYSLGGRAKWKGANYPYKLSEHPVVCVNWEDARAYCRWAGLSLPTEAQWEKAARGPQTAIYSWGNDWEANRCRHHRNRGIEVTCQVYEYAAGASGYGAYNMCGNVWEWCSDWYGSDYYKSGPPSNPTGPEKGSLRVARGIALLGDSGSYRAAFRCGGNPSDRYGRIGFRAVRALGQQS